MKKTVLSIILFAIVNLCNAQSDGDYLEIARSVLQTEKKAAISEAMELSEAEATIFWDLYNEYNGKLYEVQNKRIALIKDYATNFESMTDEKADEIWNNYMSYKQALIKLQKTYYKKFKKNLPAGKVARYFQTENKIEAMINANLALEIPLIETK